MNHNKTEPQGLERLACDWATKHAKKEAEEKARRERRRQRYASPAPAAHPFLDSALSEAIGACCTAVGRYRGAKCAAALFLPCYKEPVAVPADVKPAKPEMLEEAVPKMPRHYDHAFLVEAHLMNLGNGRKASPEKLRTASEYGFVLREDQTQTWVKTYVKGDQDP